MAGRRAAVACAPGTPGTGTPPGGPPSALPGLSTRRIAGLHPDEARTDAKDAADAARTMPHTLRSLQLTGEITAEPTVLTGFDQDLAAEATRTSDRTRGLLTQFHPSLEHVLGPRPDHPAVTWLPERSEPQPPRGKPDTASRLR